MINYLGDKFYKYDEELDKIDMVRIKKIKNENQYVLEDLSSNKDIITTKSKLEDNYVKLSPDGYVSFSIVNDNGCKDVIVTLHRKQDLKESNTPFVICRQNTLNIFDQLAGESTEEKMIVGCSVNVDTCPQDIEFGNFLACTGIESSVYIAVYIDDDLERILSYVKTEKYDNVLSKLHYNLSLAKDVKIYGTVKSLKELLIKNDFMWDFRYAFNINTVSFDIHISQKLSNPQIKELENIFKHRITDLYIFNYTREIDFKKIKKSYSLIQDKSGRLFVIAYIEGEYTNESYENMNGQDDLLVKAKLAMLNKNIK